MEPTVFEADVLGTETIVRIAKTTGNYGAIVVETPDGFELCQLWIGGKRQLVTDAAIPCMALAGLRLSLDRVEPGTKIEMKVRGHGQFMAKLCDFET